LIAAALVGGLWALIPGLLKAYMNVHEVIATIMMNYIGMYLPIIWSSLLSTIPQEVFPEHGAIGGTAQRRVGLYLLQPVGRYERHVHRQLRHLDRHRHCNCNVYHIK
jgi:hypothetical protein